MLQRSIGLLIVALALALSLFGVVVSVAGDPELGLAFDDQGSVITDVLPGGPAWRAGIQAGDQVLLLHPSDAPGGWSLTVERGERAYSVGMTWMTNRLRGSMLAALGGLAVLLLAAILMAQGSPWAFAILPVGVALGTLPLTLAGVPPQTAGAGIATFTIAGVAVALARPRPPVAPVALAIGAGLSVAWLASLAVAQDGFPLIDLARIPIAAAFSLWATWLIIDRRRTAERLLTPGAIGTFDLLYLPGIAVVLLWAMLFLGLGWLAAAGVAAGALILYPGSRRLATRIAESLLLGRLRQRVAFRAIEDERGRVAREIHDVSLQDLAAVIRQLEFMADAESQVLALRAVAGQLRAVATSLHPPVLEDLGLAPAIADLAEMTATAHPDRRISTAVDDLTTDAERPPADVETAALRIVQEAVANAISHAGGAAVAIEGSVAATAVELTVADVGPGIDRAAAARARRTGHFGLDSMRDRAEAVSGRLAVESNADGTLVRFAWEAPA